jgi:hypothetical protein
MTWQISSGNSKYLSFGDYAGTTPTEALSGVIICPGERWDQRLAVNSFTVASKSIISNPDATA